jgi:hypothetical protein
LAKPSRNQIKNCSIFFPDIIESGSVDENYTEASLVLVIDGKGLNLHCTRVQGMANASDFTARSGIDELR